MQRRPMALVTVLGGLAALCLLANPWVSAQQPASASRIAAVPSEKGGQDAFGAYQPVEDWPKDLSSIPGHQGWTFGKHVIHKFSPDGKTKLQTIGTYGEPGADDKHFNRPTYMDWFPDGSFVVSDGYNGTRVVKFDKDGKYVTSWGQKGESGKETRPGYFNNVHGIAVDPKTRRVFVNDRANHRAQVFDENGKFLDQWKFGDNPSDVHLFHIFSDGMLWAADRGTNKIIKYDLNGNFMYSWGIWGDFPGGMWGVHGISVDQEGNFYVAEVDNGGAQKYRPRPGANPAYLVGKPIRSAWQ